MSAVCFWFCWPFLLKALSLLHSSLPPFVAVDLSQPEKADTDHNILEPVSWTPAPGIHARGRSSFQIPAESKEAIVISP